MVCTAILMTAFFGVIMAIIGKPFFVEAGATKDSEKGQSYMKVEMGESAIYHYIDFPRL